MREIPGSAVLVTTFAAIAWLGCVGYRASNTHLARYDPDHGYRPALPGKFREAGEVGIYLAFSGGGTRAAAFAYGVLEGRLRPCRGC